MTIKTGNTTNEQKKWTIDRLRYQSINQSIEISNF